MNDFESGVAVGYLLNKGKPAKLTHMDVEAPTTDTSWHRYNPPSGYDGFEYFRVKGIKDKEDLINELQQELAEMEECCDEVKDKLEEITGERPVTPEDIVTAIEEIAEDEEEEEEENKIFETLYDKEPVQLISNADIPSNSAITAGDISFIIVEEWIDHPNYGYRDKQIVYYAIIDGQKYHYYSLHIGTIVVNSAGDRISNSTFYDFDISFSNGNWPGKLYLSFKQDYTNISSGTTTTRNNYVVWDVDYSDLGYESAAEATAAYTNVGGTTYTQK